MKSSLDGGDSDRKKLVQEEIERRGSGAKSHGSLARSNTSHKTSTEKNRQKYRKSQSEADARPKAPTPVQRAFTPEVLRDMHKEEDDTKKATENDLTLTRGAADDEYWKMKAKRM